MAQKNQQQQGGKQQNQGQRGGTQGQQGGNQGQERADKGRQDPQQKKPQELPDNLPGRDDANPMNPQTNRQEQGANKQRQPQPAGQEDDMD